LTRMNTNGHHGVYWSADILSATFVFIDRRH